MRPLPMITPQVRLQVALRLRGARVVRPAEVDPPQLAQDRPLRSSLATRQSTVVKRAAGLAVGDHYRGP